MDLIEVCKRATPTCSAKKEETRLLYAIKNTAQALLR